MRGLCGLGIEKNVLKFLLVSYNRNNFFPLYQGEIPSSSTGLVEIIRECIDSLEEILRREEKKHSLGIERIYLRLPINLATVKIVEDIIPLSSFGKKIITHKVIDSVKQYIENANLELNHFCIHHIILEYRVGGKTYLDLPLSLESHKIDVKSYIVYTERKMLTQLKEIFENSSIYARKSPVYAIEKEKILSAVKKAVTAGLRPYVYFIHGLPGQTIKTARQTARMIRETFRLGAEKITIYKFKPLPMSAFEKFREPPSASRSKASRIIVKEAIRINKTLKKKMIGETLEVLVAEKGEGIFRGKFIAYPLRDGPTVILNGKARLGEKVKVRIVNVMSDKLVEGAESDS